MNPTLKIYTPQAVIRRQKRQANIAWGGIFLVVIAWFSLIISAPIAQENGFHGFADSVYRFFSHICHQMPERSFFIDHHPFAVCARCTGFYAGFLLGIGIYPFFRSPANTDSFPRFWLFAAMIPIGVDFFLTFFGIWENTHLSRLITGGILGIACAFFIIPALVEIVFLLKEKLQKS